MFFNIFCFSSAEEKGHGKKTFLWVLKRENFEVLRLIISHNYPKEKVLKQQVSSRKNNSISVSTKTNYESFFP